MIFCVEADAGIRELMVYTLNASGFEAVGFPDRAALFQALENQKHQLIMLDIMLPGEHTVTVQGQRIQLTLKEYELLLKFMANPGLVFTREQLLHLGHGLHRRDPHRGRPYRHIAHKAGPLRLLH